MLLIAAETLGDNHFHLLCLCIIHHCYRDGLFGSGSKVATPAPSLLDTVCPASSPPLCDLLFPLQRTAHSVQLPIAWWLFRFSLAENVSWQPNVEGYFCLLLTYILIFDTTIVQLCFFFLCFLCFYFEVLQFIEAILVQNKYHGHSMYVCVYVCFYTNNGLKNKR